MPNLDVFIPQDALAADAEQELLSQLTDILLIHEGADPANERVRDIAWVTLHRPAAVYVGGAPATLPRYRVFASVPEGQFDDERRAGLVAAVTDAVIGAERGAYDDDPSRVWVFALEIPDGSWGGAGQVARLADIAGLAMGDAEAGARYAAQRLGARRGTPTPA
jgi:phenylpyruvate tautomerase PptA (4-oxalocrotonate tautomerase family)